MRILLSEKLILDTLLPLITLFSACPSDTYASLLDFRDSRFISPRGLYEFDGPHPSIALWHPEPIPPSRTVAFTYQVHVPANQVAQGRLLLWLPLPQQDEYQKIRDLQIETPVAHSEGREPEYGNSSVLLQPTPAELESGFDVTLRLHQPLVLSTKSLLLPPHRRDRWP